MKKIFLTGSSSYTGTKFIDLYGDKYEIIGLSRDDSTNPIDLRDTSAVNELFKQTKPDVIIHLAADIGRDATTSSNITQTNPAIVKKLIELAQTDKTPIIFTSTEAVYGGKLGGMYSETDSYLPRSPYGESKVLSEKLIIESGLPYLITRGHRYVGVSKRCKQLKQFVEAITAIRNGETIHVDSKKLFSPTLINDICDVFDYYIENDTDKKILINVGIGRAITNYDFLVDVAMAAGIDTNLIKDDGEEPGWHDDNSLSTKKLKQLGYPHRSYEEVIRTIATDLQNT